MPTAKMTCCRQTIRRKVLQLLNLTRIPPWSGRVGAEIAENTAQPPAPRFSGISFGIEDDPAAINFLLIPGSGSVGSAHFEVEHRAGDSGAWTRLSFPVANGGRIISGYEVGDSVQMRARAISLADIAGPWTAPVTLLIGGEVDLPAALDPDAISITPLLGGALIQLSTGEDTITARIQVYRASWDLLYRETDASGAAHDAAPLQTLSIPLGDTSGPQMAWRSLARPGQAGRCPCLSRGGRYVAATAMSSICGCPSLLSRMHRCSWRLIPA